MNRIFYLLGVVLLSFLNYGCDDADAWTGGEGGTGGASDSTASITALTDYSDDPNIVADEFWKYDASDNLEKVMAIGSVNPFATNNDANGELFVINGDGTNFTQLTNTTVGDIRFGRITATGNKIIFTADNNVTGDNSSTGVMSLYEINSDGTGLRQLTPATDSGSIGGYFGMNANGTSVVFSASRDYSDSAGSYPWGRHFTF